MTMIVISPGTPHAQVRRMTVIVINPDRRMTGDANARGTGA
jgi:hypothetical protein